MAGRLGTAPSVIGVVRHARLRAPAHCAIPALSVDGSVCDCATISSLPPRKAPLRKTYKWWVRQKDGGTFATLSTPAARSYARTSS